MANTYKNIIITPNRGSNSDEPKIVFSGANTTVNTDITLTVLPSSNGSVIFSGSVGQLFSVTNDLSGTIFSVNDISGVPSIDVNADGSVSLARFGGTVGIGGKNTDPEARLVVTKTSASVYNNIIINDTNGNNVLGLGSWSTGSEVDFYNPNTGVNDAVGYVWGDDTVVGIGSSASSNTPLVFWTGGNEKARISNSGYLEVGTVSTSLPTYRGKLRVLSSSLTADAGVEFMGATSGSGYGWRIASADLGSDNVPLVYERRSNSTSWTETLRITQNGDVGIGNSSPSSKLFVQGEIRATDNITAYYSDRRLKDIISTIPSSLEKVNLLSGIIYKNNQVAKSFGYDSEEEQVGVIAQEVEAVLPQAIRPAPFDAGLVDGKQVSVSGENYLTVQYEKLVPLLIEAIKELTNRVQELEKKLDD
jgi:hypothetical protein